MRIVSNTKQKCRSVLVMNFDTFVRSVGSGTTESVHATRGSTTQDGTDVIHGSCAMLFLFSWLDTERLSGRAVIASLVSMRSASAVSHPLIRVVPRVLLSPEHTITTNALYVSDSAGNVLSTNLNEKFGLEQRSGATDFRSNSYRVSTCSFPTDIRFWSSTIAVNSSHTVGSQKHEACSSRTPPRDIDLLWCLVEDTAWSQSSFVSSVQVMWTFLTERQSPDLIIASRNGMRAISLWAAAWATTTLLHLVVRKVTGQTAFDFVVSSSSMLLCTVQYSQDLVTATFVGSFSNLFSLPTALIGSDILGIMSTNSSSFH